MCLMSDNSLTKFGKGQMGSALMGPLQISCCLTGELPFTYFYLPKSGRAYPFSPICQTYLLLRGPIIVDPICPQPSVARDWSEANAGVRERNNAPFHASLCHAVLQQKLLSSPRSWCSESSSSRPFVSPKDCVFKQTSVWQDIPRFGMAGYPLIFLQTPVTPVVHCCSRSVPTPDSHHKIQVFSDPNLGKS